MRSKKRRRDDEERPNRRTRVLRDIEERDWEDELRHGDDTAEQEEDISTIPDEVDIGVDKD